MTIAQAMHALGVDPGAISAAEIAAMQRMKQAQILDRVAAARNWLSTDLARVPLAELSRIVGAMFGKEPAVGQLASAVAAYGGH